MNLNLVRSKENLSDEQAAKIVSLYRSDLKNHPAFAHGSLDVAMQAADNVLEFSLKLEEYGFKTVQIIQEKQVLPELHRSYSALSTGPQFFVRAQGDITGVDALLSSKEFGYALFISGGSSGNDKQKGYWTGYGRNRQIDSFDKFDELFKRHAKDSRQKIETYELNTLQVDGTIGHKTDNLFLTLGLDVEAHDYSFLEKMKNIVSPQFVELYRV